MFRTIIVTFVLAMLWGFISIALNMPTIERYLGYGCAGVLGYYIAKRL